MTRIEQSINRVVEQVASQTDLINQIKTLLAQKASATFDFGWAVEQIYDTNGFILTGDRYYKNDNDDGGTSFCKIKFKTDGRYDLAIECIYYGEDPSDFCLLSKINTDLDINNTNDYTRNPDSVQKIFNGDTESDPIRETVVYENVTNGVITIKCYKSNVETTGDCFQFKVRLLPQD